MSKSTQSFKKTKLVDYCDREGNVSMSKKGNDPNVRFSTFPVQELENFQRKWKLTYSNGEALSSNFDFFLDEELKNGSIKFFVLDDSDEKWIRETMNLSEREEELKPFLKSLTDFVKYRENKQIYIREVWIASENPSERRRVFTEEVIEIIPIILKQQNSNIDEWNDLLKKYQLEWKREQVHYSINMETFHSVLEEFNINKALITIVPDPVYEMSKEMMLEFGRDTVRRLSPNATWVLDSSHAILYLFQRIVCINWKCHVSRKMLIIETMRLYQSGPEGTLIRLDAIKWLKNRCFNTAECNGTFIDVRTSVALDTTTHLHMMSYHSVYLNAVETYELPNYQSYVPFPNGLPLDACSAEIPVWMTRFLLLAGWTEQFFDKASVNLANKTVQASIAGTNYIPPPGAKIGLNSNTRQEEPAHQKMLRKAQERAEKLRKRKEQSKPKKVKNPVSTNVIRPSEDFLGDSLQESKLKIARRDFENMHTVRAGTPLEEEQEVVELGEAEELVKEKSIIKKDLYTIDDLFIIDEFQKEKEDVIALEEGDELETDDMVTIELEFLEENKPGGVDQLKGELTELLYKESDDEEAGSTRRVEDLEHQLIQYVELVQTMHDTITEMGKENKDLLLKLKDVEEEKKTLKRSLDEKTRKVDDLEKKVKEINSKLKALEKKRDLDIKKTEEEKRVLKVLLEEKARKVDDVEADLNRLKQQSENQEKLLKEKKTAIKLVKLDAETSKSLISEKENENVRLNNELAKSTEANESLVLQLSRLEEDMRMLRIEEQEKNEVILKANEKLQTTVRHLSMQNEDQQKTIENLYGRLAMTPSPPVSIQEDTPESLQSQIQNIRNLCDRCINSADSEELKQFRITLQRLRNIKDRFQNKDQLKLAKTMTDKLIQMSNRSEIRELAVYEYQQYEANFQNYTQLVDLNIEKMKETRDCSLYSPLPKPPAFSDRFMNEYWLQCDKKKKELEMDISDSECLICFFEMNSDQKTLKCDHCNKITHLKSTIVIYCVPEGELIPIVHIDESIEWLRNQCSNTMRSNGQCLDTDTSISIDTWPDSHSLDIQVYQLAVHVYGLPNYHSASYFTDNSSFDSQSSHISVWMTRVMLLAGWAQQFFDEESVELANVILVLILKKVPVESKNSVVFLLKTVQASIAGLDYTHSSEEQLNCTAEREDFVSEALSKPKEVEGSEKRKKEKDFGNVPNVFSLLTSTEVFVENEAVIEKKDDLLTTSESREEEEDVTATEEKDEELEIEDVKALKKEVERLKAFEEKVQREQNESKIQIFEEKSKKLIADLENRLKTYEEVVRTMSDTAKDIKKENNDLRLKLMTLEEQRDSDIKEMEDEKQELKVLLEEKARKVDDVEKKMKLKDSEMHKMRSELKELNGLKKQLEDQEKWRQKKNTVIERLKSEAEKWKSNISEKETEIVRLNNVLAKSNETSESLVLQLSRLEEEMRMLRIEEQERSAMFLKTNEQLQTTVRHLSIQNEEQQKTIQNLYGRLAMTPSPPVSTKEDKPESVLLMLSTIRKLCDQLSHSADIEDPHQFRFTLQRLRNIKDRFQNKDQLKLAKTMTDKLIQMSNRSEIRELALYEYQQYEANFQNYTQLVDLNIEKMKETRDCSLYSPLPKPPAFSDRFMNEYWLECDKEKKESEDISDSECLICFFEMNSDQKTLKCDHCNKITHLKCASKWLQIHRSCPHCRREQLDPEEFPALS
ncbi:hypothetical protein B9Z55_009118 [Caenorhabditis nigoni]|uniref:RING-type domain-containing protein n=1 Tax=Caenorhabditis nigoni TaxID=1611254 RepID=A0A2G5URF8_9PELO|nr:hypothetical protein B9Z55_009118 [Caenorhabditis nigoni]